MESLASALFCSLVRQERTEVKVDSDRHLMFRVAYTLDNARDLKRYLLRFAADKGNLSFARFAVFAIQSEDRICPRDRCSVNKCSRISCLRDNYIYVVQFGVVKNVWIAEGSVEMATELRLVVANKMSKMVSVNCILQW